MEKNRKTGLIVTALLLIVFLAGATVLYNALTQDALQPAQRQEAGAPAATSAPAVTVAPAEKQEEAAPRKAEVAGPMPKQNLAAVFTVYGDDGTAVRLGDMRGKPTVVNFFASWCGPCQMEMPHFDEAYKAYGEEINFMMVNLCAFGNDTKEKAKAMVENGGWSFPVYFDTEGDAALKYNVRSMPTTIFVSADGELMQTRIGMMSAAQLESDIGALMRK